MKADLHQAWWRNKRGELYVIGQIVLMVLVIFGPHSINGWPDIAFPFRTITPWIGGVLFPAGLLLLISAAVRLKQQLTPLPYPVDNGKLQVNGAYRIVRHPMYSGGILMAFGWALLMTSWMTVLYAMLLVVFVDIKSRREERWLVEKYPEYKEYKRKVKKLVPFVY